MLAEAKLTMVNHYRNNCNCGLMKSYSPCLSLRCTMSKYVLHNHVKEQCELTTKVLIIILFEITICEKMI